MDSQSQQDRHQGEHVPASKARTNSVLPDKSPLPRCDGGDVYEPRCESSHAVPLPSPQEVLLRQDWHGHGALERLLRGLAHRHVRPDHESGGSLSEKLALGVGVISRTAWHFAHPIREGWVLRELEAPRDSPPVAGYYGKEPSRPPAVNLALDARWPRSVGIGGSSRPHLSLVEEGHKYAARVPIRPRRPPAPPSQRTRSYRSK